MALAFLYGTGLLPDQAAPVDVGDVSTRRVFVFGRLQPLGPRLAEQLQGYLRDVRPRLKGAEGSPALFLNAAGGRMKAEELSTRVRKYSRQIGAKIFGYSIRRAFAVHLLQNGAPLEAVQKLLNHKHIRHTAHYATVPEGQ